MTAPAPAQVPAAWRRPIRQRSRLVRRSGPPHSRVQFVHPSELEFARFLDYYRIRWVYEPVAFPIAWDEGGVSEMFTPDFYLPEHNQYVELTTMKQSLVTPKNRKLRRLQETYPEVKIKLVYRKDYDQLLAQAGYAHLDLHHLKRRDIQQILISPVELESRVRALGRKISSDHRGHSLVVVGLLKGITFFLADLARQITLPMAIDYLGIKRYSRGEGANDVDSERVAIQRDLDYPIAGRHVLIVEDIVNTGLTLDYVLGVLRAREPASVDVVTLLDRPSRRLADVQARYVGFQIPNDYVVGYGLDYRELHRNLPFICVLKPEVYASGREASVPTPS
ncbi:MAG TPA: hypoxanthine phosphoribosyltransferase [Candidatus Nitrosotalea sp.]|nr:hypoxanthine phosphoribosyltransferase [Candidatus Nitrosotalea sp.]